MPIRFPISRFDRSPVDLTFDGGMPWATSQNPHVKAAFAGTEPRLGPQPRARGDAAGCISTIRPVLAHAASGPAVVGPPPAARIEHPSAARVGPGKVDWRALEAKVVECLRLEHYSYRTEQTYLAWIRRFVEFHGWRKPSQLCAADVTAFLKHLALDMQVASSTQNQAF